MRDVTRIIEAASSSSGLNGLSEPALNLLLGLANEDNVGLVGWDGIALACMLGTPLHRPQLLSVTESDPGV